MAVATASEETELESTPREHSLVARLGAEFLGTFILIFGGIGTTLSAVQQTGNSLSVALGFGLSLVAVTILFGKVSGGHFNPAVSLASAIAGRVKWLHALYYVVVQVLGALFAGLVLFVIFNSLPVFRTQSSTGGGIGTVFQALANGFETSSPNQLPLYSALLIELVGGAVLVAVVLAAWRPSVNKAVAPIAIGFTYAVLILAMLPLTNAGLNPARSISVVFFSSGNALGQLWVFWVAPLVGAALAGLIYRGFVVPEGDSGKKPAAAEVDSVELADADEEADTEEADAPAPAKAAAKPVPARSVVADEPVVDPEAKDFFDGPAKGSAGDKK
jgi:aquaporin Z